MADKKPETVGMSDDTKTLITVLLLIFAYPIGLILMFVWTKWPWWVKLLVAFPIALAILFIVGMGALITANPGAQMEKARQIKLLNDQNQCKLVCEAEFSKLTKVKQKTFDMVACTDTCIESR